MEAPDQLMLMKEVMSGTETALPAGEAKRHAKFRGKQNPQL